MVTTSTDMAAHTGDSASPKLSKSQKKRRKRKAAKEKEASNEASPKATSPAATLPTATSNAPLNSAAVLQSQLMAEGFTAREVEVAMEEMWDQEKDYSDFGAVLEYLRDKQLCEPKIQLDESLDLSDERSTEPSSSKGATEPSINGYHYEDAVEEQKEELEGAEGGVSQDMDLGGKLDHVSNYEELTDSFFALIEWITKIAKPNEVGDFCAESSSRALSTVVRRTLEESSNATFEESSLPSLVGLVYSVFRKAGMDPTSAAEMKESLRLVLQQARQAYMKNKDNKENFSDELAHFIVARISGLVQDLMSKGDDDASKSIRHLEKEIDSLSTSLNSFGQGGIVELIQNRDVQKTAAEKASRVVSISMSSACPRGQTKTRSPSRAYSAAKNEMLLGLVGPDGVDKMNQNKLAHEEVRQKMKAAEERTSPEYQALKLNLGTFLAERSIVEGKIEELKNALRRLEEEDSMLTRRIDETQTEIASLDETSNGEIARLREALAETSKAAESDVSLRSLADRMTSYEASVKDMVSVSSVENIGNEEVAELVPNKIGLYLLRTRNYFRSEADCVQFLRSRVRSLEREANCLRNELEELTSLGLNTNARQVSHSLDQKLENIEDDNRVIEALCNEAAKMRDELADKLDKYTSIDSFPAELSSLHMNVLNGIISAISEIGIEDIGGLAQFVEDNGHGTQPQDVSNVVNVGYHQPPDGGKSTAVDATPAELATKLTWAKPDSQLKKGEVKSLRNIQEEELSSK